MSAISWCDHSFAGYHNGVTAENQREARAEPHQHLPDDASADTTEGEMTMPNESKMRCPACGGGPLRHDTAMVSLGSEGDEMMVETFIDREDRARTSSVRRAGLVCPFELAPWRAGAVLLRVLQTPAAFVHHAMRGKHPHDIRVIGRPRFAALETRRFPRRLEGNQEVRPLNLGFPRLCGSILISRGTHGAPKTLLRRSGPRVGGCRLRRGFCLPEVVRFVMLRL